MAEPMGRARLNGEGAHQGVCSTRLHPPPLTTNRPPLKCPAFASRAREGRRQGVKYPLLEGMKVSPMGTVDEEVPRDGETMGEILLRGNVVMKGYLKDEGATEKAFEGGWFHSGDLAVVHDNGYIEIRDRYMAPPTLGHWTASRSLWSSSHHTPLKCQRGRPLAAPLIR